MAVHVYVDFENLMIRLRELGHTAQPHDMVAVVTSHLDTGAERPGAEVVRVYVPRPRCLPSDIAALRALPDVVVIAVDGWKDLADVEIAVDSALAHARNEDAVAVISDDRDMARLVEKLKAACRDAGAGARHTLCRLTPLANPGPNVVGQRAVFDAHLPAAGLADTGWNDWSAVAWSMTRAVSRSNNLNTIVAKTAPRVNNKGEPIWSDIASPVWFAANLRRIEILDAVLSAIWRQEWGLPLTADDAVRVAGRIDDIEQAGEQVVAALLHAGLLRTTALGHVVCPPELREGVLYPLRRCILRLHREEGECREATLRNLHRARIAVAAIHGERRGDHEFEYVAQASWGLTTRALFETLKVAERPSAHTVALRMDHSLVNQTRVTAVRILETLDNGPHPLSHFRDALAGKPVPHLKRWLRCLRDVGLVREDRGTWSSGPEPLP